MTTSATHVSKRWTQRLGVSATMGWTASEPPRPNLIPDPQAGISAESCPITGGCEAIGTYADGSNDIPGLMLAQSGATWQPTEAPLPVNASTPHFVDLNALACTSAGNCVAVGDYSEDVAKQGFAGDTHTLIEAESNGVWTAQSTGLPSGADRFPLAYFASVSCPAVHECVAVGAYLSRDTYKPLVALQGPFGWKVKSVKLPKDRTSHADAFLTDITCWAVAHCLSVGAYPGTYSEDAVAVSLSGSSLKSTEVGDGKLATFLGDVACPAANRCTAIGDAWSRSDASTKGFAASLTKGVWKPTLTPLPVSAGVGNITDRVFNGLACTGVRTCVGVGAFLNEGALGPGVPSPLLIAESGGHWFAPAVKGPSGDVLTEGNLYALICPSSTTCISGGYYAEGAEPAQPLLMTGIGGSWTGISLGLPVGGGAGSIDSIACVHGAGCASSGSYVDSNGNTQPLAEVQSGQNWSASALGLPLGAGQPQNFLLGSIACGGVGSCLALGTNSGRAITAESSTGGVFSETSVAPPSDANALPEALASSPDCLGPNYCTSGGYYLDNQGNTSPLITTDASGVWTTFRPSLPADAETSFQQAEVDGISCWSAGNCVAVGNYFDTDGYERGMILTETAGTWGPAVDAPVPNAPGGNPLYEANGVSCVSATDCSVTGAFVSGVNVHAMLDSLSSGVWVTTEAPLPANGNGKFLHYDLLGPIRCLPGACITLGMYLGKSGQVDSLIDTGDQGSWSATEPPVPNSKTDFPNPFFIGGLNDSACESAGHCFVVGGYLSFTKTGLDVAPWILSGHGTSWQVVKGLPAVVADTNGYGLSSVACTSTSCEAVGAMPESAVNTAPAIATLSGSSWSVGLAPLPAGGLTGAGTEYGFLNGVACPAAGSCVAAGGFVDSSYIEQPLLESQ